MRGLSTETAERSTVVDRADLVVDTPLTPRYYPAKFHLYGSGRQPVRLDCLTTQPGLAEGNGLVFGDPEEMAEFWSE